MSDSNESINQFDIDVLPLICASYGTVLLPILFGRDIKNNVSDPKNAK